MAARKSVTSGKIAVGCQRRNDSEPQRPAKNHLLWLVKKRLKTPNKTIGILW